jgi:ATP-dependent Lon protease
MDVIQLSGYTEEEKLGIAKKYLVPKQLKEHGLKRSQLTFTDKGLRTIIREYTREAGVRQLERQLAAVCRKAARRIAEGETTKMSADEKLVHEWLGPRRFVADVRKRTSEPGVATGLAVTSVGGDVLFIEATAYPGKGKLTITGQLGEVMQESAQAALSWVRGHAATIVPELAEGWFASNDIHIHVPAGAVPKDGPSAGVAMAVALSSLLSGRPVSSETAMTGELTLTGQVLPIGGVKEKSLAAQRAGIKRVIVPDRNEGDVLEIPKHERAELEFIYVDRIEKALEAAIGLRVPSPGRR